MRNVREKMWGLAALHQSLLLWLKCCHQLALELQRAVSLSGPLHCMEKPLYTQAALITWSALPCQGSITVLAVLEISHHAFWNPQTLTKFNTESYCRIDPKLDGQFGLWYWLIILYWSHWYLMVPILYLMSFLTKWPFNVKNAITEMYS